MKTLLAGAVTCPKCQSPEVKVIGFHELFVFDESAREEHEEMCLDEDGEEEDPGACSHGGMTKEPVYKCQAKAPEVDSTPCGTQWYFRPEDGEPVIS